MKKILAVLLLLAACESGGKRAPETDTGVPSQSRAQLQLAPGDSTPILDTVVTVVIDTVIDTTTTTRVDTIGWYVEPFPPPPVDTTPVPPSPPPSASCPNQPAGFRTVRLEPFNVLPPVKAGKMPLNAWYRETQPQRFTVQGGVITGLFAKGSRGGTAPFKMTLDFAPAMAVYQCITTRLSSNFTNNGNAGTKFGFLLTNSTILNPYFNLYSALGLSTQFNGQGKLNTDIRGKVPPRGAFFTVELLEDFTSGTLAFWVNGVKQPSSRMSGVVLTTASSQRITGVTWNPTYGGGLNPVPFNLTQDISEWLVSTK